MKRYGHARFAGRLRRRVVVFDTSAAYAALRPVLLLGAICFGLELRAIFLGVSTLCAIFTFHRSRVADRTRLAI